MSEESGIAEPTACEPLSVACCLGAVRLIWINNRRQRNALSEPTRDLLFAHLTDAMKAEDVRCVVLAGAGGSFCAGGDISSMSQLTVAAARQRLNTAHQIAQVIRQGPKPVIAAVEGWATGAGLSLAAACDIVVASRLSRLSVPFSKIGLMPDLGLLNSVPSRIGPGRTRWLAFSGRAIDAEKAYEWGLVDELAEPGRAVIQSLDLAADISANAPLSIAVTKSHLNRGPCSFESTLTIELDAQAALFSSDDFAEGRNAFLQKRAPQFKGR